MNEKVTPRTAIQPYGAKDGSIWREQTRWSRLREWLFGWHFQERDGRWTYFRPTWVPRRWRGW